MRVPLTSGRRAARALPVLLALLSAALPGCHPAARAKGGGLELLADESPLPAGVAERDARLNYHDFGRVPEGEVVRHVFRLRNADPRPVAILRVVPGCGCTVASLWTVRPDGSRQQGEPITSKAEKLLVVESGALAEIEVQINSRDLQTKNVDKLVTMSVQTDSENGYFFSLEVHILVEQPFAVVPPTLALGFVPANGGGEGKVEIVQAGHSGRQLKELGPLPAGVHATLGSEIRNGLPVWTLRAGLDAPLEIGPQHVTLLVATEESAGVPGRPLEVHMTAQVVPDLLAEPARIVFSCARDETRTAATEVRSLLAGQRLRVTALDLPEADRSFLAADYQPVEADSEGTSLRWRITLTTRAPLPEKELLSGQLLLHLDDPQHPSLPLEYVIHVKQQ